MSARRERAAEHAVEVGGRSLTLRFPRRQASCSALVGYAPDHVVKILKTAPVLSWARRACGLSEPAYVRGLRLLPLADSAFAPTLSLVERITEDHRVCAAALRGLDPAAAVVVGDALGGLSDPVATVLSEVFAVWPTVDLMPAESGFVAVTLPDGTASVALMQRRVHGPAFTQPLTGHRGDHRPAHSPALMMILLAVALRLSADHHLGLDLTPRWAGRDVRIDNVLVAPDGALSYVDFFGLLRPRGNAADRLGFGLLYGTARPVLAYLRALSRHYTREAR